jgi:hypothetical protein
VSHLPSQRFLNQLKLTNDFNELESLRQRLAIRREIARIKFVKNRSVKNGETYRRISDEHGKVRTKLQLLFPNGKVQNSG